MYKATRNQLANTRNNFQGAAPKVLFICSAGLLRSATAAHTFSESPYSWNTRSAASNKEYGLNIVNEALLYWAEEIYVMDAEHIELMRELNINLENYEDKIINLDVSDSYGYREPELVELLKIKMGEYHS